MAGNEKTEAEVPAHHYPVVQGMHMVSTGTPDRQCWYEFCRAILAAADRIDARQAHIGTQTETAKS